MRPEQLAPWPRVLLPLALALVAEAGAWLLIALQEQVQLAAWFGHPGLLMATHLVTLGVLALAIQGAGWQLVPVLTARPAAPLFHKASGALNVLLILAIPLMLVGFSWLPWVGVVGATMALSALLLRSLLVLPELWRSQVRPLPRLWLLFAELSLWAGVLIGGALYLARVGHPLLSDHLGGLERHAALLLAGWVGGWALGLGSLLLPMFSVAPEPRPWLLASALPLWFGGLALGWTPAWSAGAVLVVLALLDALRRRIKRKLEPGLLLAAGALALLSLLALGAPWLPGPLVVAAGLGLLALPFLRGVFLKIGPFLAWAHSTEGLRGPLPEAPALNGGVAVLAVLGSLIAGILLIAGLLGSWWIARLGGLFGAIAAIAALAAFLRTVASLWQARRARSALPGMEST